jgi:hypothetical protein
MVSKIVHVHSVRLHVYLAHVRRKRVREHHGAHKGGHQYIDPGYLVAYISRGRVTNTQ